MQYYIYTLYTDIIYTYTIYLITIRSLSMVPVSLSMPFIPSTTSLLGCMTCMTCMYMRILYALSVRYNIYVSE